MIVRADVLYDGSLASPRRDVDIVIEGPRITEVREANGEFDLRAACVTPGLVNAHVHLEMRGDADTMAGYVGTTPSQRMLWAVANARKTLEAGVTTVRDLGCSESIVMELRDAIETGALPGPRISAAGNALCMTGGHGRFIGREIDSPWEARKAVREQRQHGADCLKLIATGGVLTKGAVPGVSQLTYEEMYAACTEAHKHGMRVGAHAIGTEGIKNALRAGVDSIEHGHMLDDEAIALFKERDVYLVPTLAAPTCILENVEGGAQPEFVVRKAREINEHMLRNLKRAYVAGIKVAGGSDAGTPFNFHENYAREVEMMHHILGMTQLQALHAATAVAAELIGLHRGTLTAGEPADLLLLDAAVEDDITTLGRPQTVIKAGAIAASR